MREIFNYDNIYPRGRKIKEHYKDFFDSIFIAYLPFFQVENKTSRKDNYKKSEKISFEQAKKELEILNDIPAPNAEIYSYSNEDYPTDIEIYDKGRIVKWETIIKEAKLKNAKELNKALRTSLGALRPIFAKPELSDKLNLLTTKKDIWYPTEGRFDVFSKVGIYKTFMLFNKNEILLSDEFFEDIKSINIHEVTEYEFINKFRQNDYFIYSSDKEILFAIDWDSFFFLIATDQDKMNQIISKNYFEGFLCDSETTHDWDYLPGEIEQILKIEKMHSKSENKNWWRFWK